MWRVICFAFVISLTLAEYTYKTNWFEVPLDHFGFSQPRTFKIKYLVNDSNWDEGGGPIFFYTGNEGQIELFAQHTGFMWDIAEQFRAKLVFAEHRYYGESMPFGNKSLDNENIGYLTSEQALADYADLLDYLQGGGKLKYPVIAFGGSYGGMLAAYFRIKYPHLVEGAIAASAPVHMFPGMVPCEVFARIVTSSFKLANPYCATNIRNSWATVRSYTASENGTKWLKENWKLCDPVKNETQADTLMEFLENMYITVAMVNYPFESDFLVPLPGQPVRYICQYLNESLTGEELMKAIGKVLQAFTNYNGKSKCVDYLKGEDYGNLDASGWDFQACTEMVMPQCTTGVEDMFEPEPWNFTKYAQDCHKKYNVLPRENMARLQYGGDNLQFASNIVFSNGLLDPWAGGGILNTQSDTVKAVVIIDGAHHLDLMPKNEKDPVSVLMARSVHKENIGKWIQGFKLRNEKSLNRARS